MNDLLLTTTDPYSYNVWVIVPLLIISAIGTVGFILWNLIRSGLNIFKLRRSRRVKP